MWKYIILFLILVAIMPTGLADNVSSDIPFPINLTCPIQFCTRLIIEILNRTYVPKFDWNLLGVNCTIVPYQTNVLATSKHQLTCDFPLLNFSSQEQFEQGTIPVPIFYFRTLQNLSINFQEFQQIKGELPFWQIATIVLVIGIIGTFGYYEFISTREE